MIADIDSLDEENDSKGTIVLMTLHSAKGIGVSCCIHYRDGGKYIPAFPFIGDEDEMEEERRLIMSESHGQKNGYT